MPAARKPNARFYAVTRKEMEALLLRQKFKLLNDPKDAARASWPRDLREGYQGRPVSELVYGCRVRPLSDRMTVRVYSGIDILGQSRDVGEDAIRVMLVWLDIDAYEAGDADEPTVRIVGVEKRVHRIQTWANNLQDRINRWQEGIGPKCPQCGVPCIARSKRDDRSSKFWGCCRFPECRGTLPFEG